MDKSLVDVALLAFGGPSDEVDVPGFLQRTTGHEPSAETLAVLQERYRVIGGSSPLPAITARQARALQARLIQELAFPLRVRHGFLYAEPSIADCVAELDAHERIALPLSPFGSRLAADRYREALDAAGAHETPSLGGWYASRGFVRAISRRAGEALDGCDANEWAVVFTARNVPAETVLEGDPYVEQLQQTISQIVPAVMPGDWRFGFQSKGRGEGEWLEPDVSDVVAQLVGDGWKKVLVVPVGSVSDELETLYDLDVVVREQVEGLGAEYRRSQAPNDSPVFIEALADVVVDYLARRPVEHQIHRPGGPHDHGGS